MTSTKHIKESRYNLHITDDKGTLIAKVDPSHTQYIEEVSPGFFSDTTDEYLRGKGMPQNTAKIKDLSIELKGGKFVVTDSNNNTVTEIDNFTLTKYGEEIFHECFESTMEYHVPTDNSHDQASDETYNEQYSEPYSAMNLEIL